MFGHKKEIAQLWQRINLLGRESKRILSRYNNLVRGIDEVSKNISSEKLYTIPLEIDSDDFTRFYFIELVEMKGVLLYLKELDYTTYCLNNSQKVCHLNAEIKMTKDNVLQIELVQLDTFEETRCGHASRLIKQLFRYAKDNSIQYIWGELDPYTPIGIDSLKEFYKSNGFCVSNRTFYIQLSN